MRSGEYLGTGYYGKQNKGIGWVVSRNEEEAIDSAFFERKIADAIARRSKFYEDPDTTAFRVFNGEGDGIRRPHDRILCWILLGYLV